jgi:hypothetical protein
MRATDLQPSSQNRWRKDMSDEAKKVEILKMFSCFPSAATMDREQAAMTTAAYLETLRNIPLQVVSAACDALRRRASPFPPSAGEVYDECTRIEGSERQREAERAPRHSRAPRPIELLSPKECEASKTRVQAMADQVKAELAAPTPASLGKRR